MKAVDWLKSDLALDIWENKYQHNEESFEDWLDRVSAGNKDLREMIVKKQFLFGGRILANRGLNSSGKKITYSNCYVVTPPEDSLESIFETGMKLARTYSYGGGCGVDISKLAPSGAVVRNAAEESSGASSFMVLYNCITDLIAQKGRRGALMISMSVDHPDILEFIQSKNELGKLEKTNISVRLNNEFMEAVEKDYLHVMEFHRPETGTTYRKTVPARKIMQEICKQIWETGEPGVLFWDQVESYNMLQHHPEFKFGGVNPCVVGSTEVLTVDGYKRIDSLVGSRVLVWNGKEFSLVQPRVTGHNQPILKIGFSDGNVLECTPYHKFHLDSGIVKQANELMVGDELVRFKESTLSEDKIGVCVTSIEDEGKIADKVYCFNEPINHTAVFNGIITGQCGEEPLPAGGSCLLGSINLSEFVLHPFTNEAVFNFVEFEGAVEKAIRALEEVREEGQPLHPLKEQQESVDRWRQIGLGIMGYADMLIKLGIRYGSNRSSELIKEIGWVMAEIAVRTSIDLYDDKGGFPAYNGSVLASSFFTNFGDRDQIQGKQMCNSQLLSIAPTGTISTMLEVSGGIEPIYDVAYIRKTESLNGEDTYYRVNTPIIQEYLDHGGKLTDECIVTAHTLDPMERVREQANWQTYIDASISSTVNLPESATVEDIYNLIMTAWKTKCKGLTLFRDGCRREGILNSEVAVDTVVLKRGDVEETDNELIGRKTKLMTGCGSLQCLPYFDPEDKGLRELFLLKGATGGCNNFMVAVSRLTSLCARLGGTTEVIADQLESCGICPSYASRRAIKGDTSPGSSCPVAVGKALLKMQEEVRTVEDDVNKNTEVSEMKGVKCPKCGVPMAIVEGCVSCRNCGYSKCS